MIAVFARKSTPYMDKLRKIKHCMDKDYLPKEGRRVYVNRAEAKELHKEISTLSYFSSPDFAPEGHWVNCWGFEIYIYEDDNESC